jgi:hypothetical protein
MQTTAPSRILARDSAMVSPQMLQRTERKILALSGISTFTRVRENISSSGMERSSCTQAEESLENSFSSAGVAVQRVTFLRSSPSRGSPFRSENSGFSATRTASPVFRLMKV